MNPLSEYQMHLFLNNAIMTHKNNIQNRMSIQCLSLGDFKLIQMQSSPQGAHDQPISTHISASKVLFVPTLSLKHTNQQAKSFRDNILLIPPPQKKSTGLLWSL